MLGLRSVNLSGVFPKGDLGVLRMPNGATNCTSFGPPHLCEISSGDV